MNRRIFSNSLCSNKSKEFKDCGAESCKLDVVKAYKANKGSCRCEYMDCEVFCHNTTGQYNGCSGGDQQKCRKSVIDNYKKHKANCDCAFMAGRVA